MNNKGQTLVIFIILLPIFCILIGLVFNQCNLSYQKRELKEIANLVCSYAIQEEKKENIEQLALENDQNISKVEIVRENNSVKIILSKKTTSLYSQLLGKNNNLKVETSCIE